MALKNLFDMVKADRYTQDGREALIKAQEEETEDARRTYQIGEISEATGLQKTAQGWKPPKETKFGKVKQNKEGQWGVQTKQGKGSDFLKHKSEKEASRALANYTAGYNTTERSKQDPHSDQARQVKHWDKETEKIRKQNRAEGRAAHAAQFQNQPALSQTDGKGNKVEIKITESKGGGFYVDKYVNGKKVGINNANTRESAEAKAKSMMEQHMADPDYRAEEKPAAPRREAVSAGRMMKDLDGNFWSRPEDFKEDITSRGWDVDEMTNEYAVISNEAGSQYEVRFDDHSDDGDLTVRNFKALQIDEDDDDDSLEDSAPSLSEIVDRVYNIGEISEKTGLQKTANGWRPVKKGAAGKTSRANKEEAIRKDLGLTAGEDMSRFSDEQIEKMYAKTQQTPEQQKADFDKSKIGQAVNKGRQEFAAEKTRQKELASKTNAIGLPKESKRAADFTKYKRDTGLNLYGKSAQEGEQYMKENGFELQPESRPDRKIYKNGFGEKYEASYTPEGVFNGGSHSYAPIPGRDNHKAYQEGMGNKYLGQKKREDGTVTQVYLTPEGKYERSDFTAKGEYNGGSTSSEEFYKKWYNDDLEDSAPRVLTGDCRIRIRKEKPALTGDTKIRVRK